MVELGHDRCGDRLRHLLQGRLEVRGGRQRQAEAERYAVDAHIPGFAGFAGASGLRVLEIGVGAGTDFVQWLRFGAEAVGVDAQGRLLDGGLRSQIAKFEIDELAFRSLLERTGDRARIGHGDPAFSSALKYYGAELNKRRYELMASAAGSDGLEWEGKRSRDGALARSWLRSKGNSIEGGTSEVQLNIVAKRILGLPGAST